MTTDNFRLTAYGFRLGARTGMRFETMGERRPRVCSLACRREAGQDDPRLAP